MRSFLALCLVGVATADLDIDFSMPGLEMPPAMKNLIRMQHKMDMPDPREIAGLPRGPRHAGPGMREGPHERAEIPGLKAKMAQIGDLHPETLGSPLAEKKAMPSPQGRFAPMEMPKEFNMANMKMGLNQDQVSNYKNMIHDNLDAAKKVDV